MPTIEFKSEDLCSIIPIKLYLKYYERILEENNLTIKDKKWIPDYEENSLTCTYKISGKLRDMRVSRLLSHLKGDRGRFLVNVGEDGKVEEIVSYSPRHIKLSF